MATFLVYTAPATGHAFPLVPGLLALRERGHAVDLRTAPEVVAAVRRAGLAAGPVDPRIAAISVGGHEERRPAARLRREYGDLMARGRLDRLDVARAIAEAAPDAVLVDVLAYGAQVEVERSGLPWALTLPSLLPLPGAGIPPYGLGLAPARGPLGRLRDCVLWRAVLRAYGRAMMGPYNVLREEAGLGPLAGPLELLRRPDAVVALTGEPLEYPRADLPGHVRMVGAQVWDPPPALRWETAFLDEPGDPWVLVTCSTDPQGDEALAAAAIDALRDEQVRVLVTLAGARDAGALPSAPNVRVARFVPHGPVLDRAAAVVCHGGMGIVGKAMAAGVPIVAVPFGRDQPEIARRVEQCGAGVLLPRRQLGARRLRAAVARARAGRADALAAGARLRAAGGAEAFADAAEGLVRVHARPRGRRDSGARC